MIFVDLRRKIGIASTSLVYRENTDILTITVESKKIKNIFTSYLVIASNFNFC